MPTYRSAVRDRKTTKKKSRRLPRKLPRDPRKLFRWAALGTDKDYERLRKLARKARHSIPKDVDVAAFERLQHVDRLRMIEEIQASEQHDVSAGFFLDSLNWLFDKVPWGGWAWPLRAAQTSINALKGDGLNEVDEQYARLVGATYGEVSGRPYVIDHWKRQVQFDSSYISVWDNPDGHRVIAVRGTQGGGDVGQDVLIGLTGRASDLLYDEMLQIIAGTEQGVVIDLAAHSLGASLALESMQHKNVYDAVHETYLFSPAYSPFLKGTTDSFERDGNVRYFINVKDVVSMGGIGHAAPSNVVYRSSGGLASAHKLAQWQGASAYQDPIMHAPPETKLHAHKAVIDYGKEDQEYAGSGDESVRPSGGDAALPETELRTSPAFDFGVDVDFDYAAL